MIVLWIFDLSQESTALRLVYALEDNVFLVKFLLEAADGKFEQFILSFRFDDLVLEEIFVQFKRVCPGGPKLNFFPQLRFFFLLSFLLLS